MHSVAFVGTVADGGFDGAFDGLLDHGDVFYAPAVCADDGGRTLLWGWLQERLDDERQAALSHAGALSLPRVAALHEGRLRVVAAPEVERLRKAPLAVYGDDARGPVVAARAQMELLAAFTGSTGRGGWALTADAAEAASIVVDADRGLVEVTVADASGGDRTFAAALHPRERHELRVLIDGSVLEVFADDDRAVSTRSYPGGSWDSARLTVGGDLRSDSVEGWDLSTEVIS
jgi:beta-fructofuranosidase